jgi:hypothetical protein
MRRQTLLNEARDLMALFVNQVRGSTAVGHTDINKVSERFLVELFREVFALPDLRDLNAEKANFPGLDLASDASSTAFQITATTDVQKVKDTLRTVLDRGLHTKYPQIRIYVLTEKRVSRAQRSIDQLTQGRLRFELAKHVLDFRDVLRAIDRLETEQLERVVGILKRNFAHSPTTPSVPVVRVPPAGTEPVELNLLPISFPGTLYLADHVAPRTTVIDQPRRRHGRRPKRPASARQLVVQDIMHRGFDAPEDFEIHGDQLISLHDPTEAGSALLPYLDAGTLTPLSPAEFYGIDDDHLRLFKSLLRRALQRQLRPEFIHWQHEGRLFFFAPSNAFDERLVAWKEERMSERVVFQATMKKDKPEEVLTCKHLAFYVDFHLIQQAWYMAITPTWYFSIDGYRRDNYGAKRISWLKRQENDLQVHTHFRFISHHLRVLQEQSLFDGPHPRTFIRISDPLRFRNHPYLPDHLWNPQGPRTPRDDGQGSLAI